jgi:hypothetical protein
MSVNSVSISIRLPRKLIRNAARSTDRIHLFLYEWTGNGGESRVGDLQLCPSDKTCINISYRLLNVKTTIDSNLPTRQQHPD